ncbi:hypothetical protein BRDID11002_72110 [Bradyrhizobium diazoefficiens]
MAVFYTFRNGQVAQIREIIDSYDLVQQVLEREIGTADRGGAGGRELIPTALFATSSWRKPGPITPTADMVAPC